MQFADFKVSYGIESTIIDELFEEIWRLACERDNNINAERPRARAPLTRHGQPPRHRNARTR
jgi:hypothetical protein